MTRLSSIVQGIPLGEEPGLGALTIGGYLREVTTRYAGREALVMHTSDGVVRWNYATLWERSVEVARALRAAGICKGDRVGVLMTNRPEFLASMFGIALAGGVTVAFSTFSTTPELKHLLQVAGVSVLLVESQVAQKNFASMLCDIEPAIRTSKPGQLASVALTFLRHIVLLEECDGAISIGGCLDTWPAFLALGNATPIGQIEAAAATVMPADAGVLFFSSGTTSTPKGILHTQRAVAIQWWRWVRILDVKNPVRTWTANGFFWSGNFSMVIGSTLSIGGTLVLQPTFRAEQALELMQAEQVNLPLAWPHQWAKLEGAANFGQIDLSAVRYIDPRTPLGRHPSVTTHWHEPPAYGTTETLTIVASWLASTALDARGTSQGEILPGNTLKIIDPVSGVVVPRGERGEIAVKGPTLMLGYIGIPGDETFDKEGFFRTGDGGYVDEDGRLYWEGRLTDIIKTGGANVSPLEIDAVLVTCPGIKMTRTVGVPHETLGEVVVACIVPHAESTVDERAVRDFLKGHLASYKVPRHVLFFREEDIQMTGSDKVKATALIELATTRLQAYTPDAPT